MQRSKSRFFNMKSCYIELYIYAGKPVFYHIPYVFNKKINTGNLKKISVPKSPHISFSALKVGKKALIFFSFKRLGKYSSRRTRDFFCCFCFVFSMKVGKKEADWTWRQKQPSVLIPPPPTPCLPLCCIHYLTKPGNTLLYCQKNLKYYR